MENYLVGIHFSLPACVQFFFRKSHYLSLSSENTIGGSPIYSRDFGDIQPHIQRQIKEETVHSLPQQKPECFERAAVEYKFDSRFQT